LRFEAYFDDSSVLLGFMSLCIFAGASGKPRSACKRHIFYKYFGNLIFTVYLCANNIVNQL